MTKIKTRIPASSLSHHYHTLQLENPPTMNIYHKYIKTRIPRIPTYHTLEPENSCSMDMCDKHKNTHPTHTTPKILKISSA